MRPVSGAPGLSVGGVDVPHPDLSRRYIMIEGTRRRDRRGHEPRRVVRTVEEAALLLGISRAHAYRLISRGELRHIRLGRRIVVPDRAIDELLDCGDGPIHNGSTAGASDLGVRG